MDKWKCVCGNYNTENVCLKCGRLKDSVYTDFFEWNVKITRHFKEAIESTNYFIGFFKFDITRTGEYTNILCRILPYVDGKDNHRYITVDSIKEEMFLNDGEIVDKINNWLISFNQRTNVKIEMN